MKRKYRGGILLTMLVVLALFSFTYTLLLEETTYTQKFTKASRDYYTAKTMMHLFLVESKHQAIELQEKGEQLYSSGILHYSRKKEMISFTIRVNGKNFSFQERAIF